MRHQTTKSLHAYWETLRAGRLTPYRTEVEPTEIGALLPNAFILERIEGGEARFRLAGDAVCDLIGVELNGMSIASIWNDASRDRIVQMIEGVASAPATAVVTGGSAAVGAIESTQAEFSFLPLRNDFGAFNRIIGSAVAVEGERVWRGRRPRLFGIGALRLTAIESDEPRPDAPPPYRQTEAADYPVVAESATPFELKTIDGRFANEARAPVAASDRARPHLRLVKGED